MRLSSVRSWKEELLQESYVQFAVSRSMAMPMASRAVRTFTQVVSRPALALGVAPDPNRKSQYKLAVRVFKGQENKAMPMIRNIMKHEKEVDIVTSVSYLPRAVLRAGGSCGHFNISAGTLGAFVEDADQYYMLSNNHVFADSDKGQFGDPIVQPGPIDVDSGKQPKTIGHLHRWIPLHAQTVDAALAIFSDEVSDFYPWDYRGIGTIKRQPVPDRFDTLSVTKRGRTTDVTKGTVSAFELDGVEINYGTRQKPNLVSFDNQIEVIGTPPEKHFSQPGDSGSLIIDADTMMPYALLYGGGLDDQGIDRTLAHYLPDVLEELGVNLVQ